MIIDGNTERGEVRRIVQQIHDRESAERRLRHEDEFNRLVLLGIVGLLMMAVIGWTVENAHQLLAGWMR